MQIGAFKKERRQKKKTTTLKNWSWGWEDEAMENKGKKNREEKKNRRVKEKPACLFYLPLEREQKEEGR